jgi:arylsulfatase A-like enzyme
MTLRGRALALLVVVGLAAAVILAVIPWRDPLPAVDRTRDQNVLLITIDTLRADTMAMYGGPAATPNLERLAADGIRYTFAHAHAVLTLPSHASILTGLNPYEHRVRDNHSGFRLPGETTTAAELLKGAGFATGAFVSAFPLDRRFGLDAGFDRYDDETGKALAPVDFLAPERDGRETVRAARAWIAQQRTRWFAWVHLFEPHAPYRAPERFQQIYGQTPRGTYAAEVAFSDSILGPLLSDAAVTERPTLVIATSDHGEALGEHDEATHGLFAYEATLRVPLIVAQLRRNRVPPEARARRPTVNHEPARHADLLPTVLDSLDMPIPAHLHGRSLLRRGSGQTSTYFESMGTMLTRGWAPLSGVIHDRMKLIDLPLPELYDLTADPDETTNLYARKPDTREPLHALLRSFGARPPESTGVEDPDVLSRLRSLGYVGGSVARKARYTEEDDPKRLTQLDRDMDRARWLRDNHQPQESIALYRSIIERRPTMEPAWRFLAFIQWESGDRAGAIATLEETIRRGIATGDTVRQLEEYLVEAGRQKNRG